MNRANIAALGLGVAAQTFFLLGLFLSAMPLLKSPMTTIEQTSIFIEPDVPPFFAKIAENMPWLLSMVIFPMFAVPAGFFLLGGLAVWRFIGRRRQLDNQREALHQKDLESRLQALLTEIIESLARPAVDAAELPDTRGLVYKGMAKVLPSLDSGRQGRFHLFLGASGLEQEDLPLAGRVVPRRPRFRQRTLLARIIALGCFLVSTFIFLWGLLALVFYPQAEMLEATLGIKIDRIDMLMQIALSTIIAAAPFTFGLGLLWLSRLDGQLRDMWEVGLAEARGELLNGFCHQLDALSQASTGAPPVFVRSLTSSAFPELDGPGKRRVLESLTELGLVADPQVLDASIADFSRVDLTKMDLAGACLPGFNLRGADLSGANLSGANLAGACLYGANLKHAELGDACLVGADLRRAWFHFARLRGADLQSAHLEGANFWQAEWTVGEHA